MKKTLITLSTLTALAAAGFGIYAKYIDPATTIWSSAEQLATEYAKANKRDEGFLLALNMASVEHGISDCEQEHKQHYNAVYEATESETLYPLYNYQQISRMTEKTVMHCGVEHYTVLPAESLKVVAYGAISFYMPPAAGLLVEGAKRIHDILSGGEDLTPCEVTAATLASICPMTFAHDLTEQVSRFTSDE